MHCTTLASVLLGVSIALAGAATPTLTTLVEFTGTNGANPGDTPHGSLVQGTDGNFYGMTKLGGSNNLGTVFKMTPAGVLTTLVDFNGTNGANPQGNLVQGPDGNFYGMTTYGGANDITAYGETRGGGTAFKMTPAGVLTKLVNFGSGPATGFNPEGSLLLVRFPYVPFDQFYGTTTYGGATRSVFTPGAGTIFKMTLDGAVTTLKEFNHNTDPKGNEPRGSLVLDTNTWRLYGTTELGGPEDGNLTDGTVFRMSLPLAGIFQTLVEFDGYPINSEIPNRGRWPRGSLVRGTDGNFYGTTSYSGMNDCGTIFKMTPAGVLATMVDFNGTNGYGVRGGLVQGTDGNFYGMTTFGGANGAGTIFRLTPAGVLTTLVSFGTDTAPKGSSPYGNLVQGTDGNFYGMTAYGGVYPYPGYGTIFKLDVGLALMPPDNITLSASSVAENRASGTTVGTFTAQDPNSDDTHTFTLVPGTGDTNNASFSIGNGTNLLTAAVFDYETKSSYSIRVRATDGGGLTYEKAFTITVNNTNEAPTNITLSASSVVENSASGTTVGYFTAPDPDSGDTHTFTLVSGAGSTDNASFSIGNGTNLLTAASFDYETKSSYSIRVRATDGGGLKYEKPFTIAVSNVPEVRLTTLVEFADTTAPQGRFPYGSLVQGADGNFYGLTEFGGSNNFGTAFKMTPAGVLTTLVEFNHDTAPKGSYPRGHLVPGADGNFYGLTQSGGSNNLGTAFQLTPAGVLTTLVEFNNNTAPKGSYPQGSLVQFPDGNFYGMTSGGGAYNSGTVFQLTPAGALTTLVSFRNDTAPKGRVPRGSLVPGPDGNFYGLTSGSGTNDAGTAFQMTPAGVLTTLVEFNHNTAPKGAYPLGSLAPGVDGNFYGLALQGGANGVGTAFQLTPAGALTTLVEFSNNTAPLGAYPHGSLVLGTDGNFYGMTQLGGSNNFGTVFRMTPGGVLTTLVEFNYNTVPKGAYPFGNLVQGTDGNFYGMTAGGGSNNVGTAFKLDVELAPFPVITASSLKVLGNGSFQFAFSNADQLAWTVLGTTNLAQPFANWTVLGTATNLGGGLFQFTDTNAATMPFRLYKLRLP